VRHITHHFARHTRGLRRRAALLVLAAGAAATLALPSGAEDLPASAADASQERAERAKRSRTTLLQEAESRGAWQSEYRTLLVDFEAAFAEEEAARIDRRQKKQDQRRRGEPRRASDQRIADAATQREAARDKLDEFYSRARSQGVERAWLYTVDEEFPDLIHALPNRG
jgi:hypothetical protein